MIEKMLVISIFVGKIKLNFHYKKMTEKMYDKLLEKYKNSVFQILKISKAFSNFGLNLTIRKKFHRLYGLLVFLSHVFGSKCICKSY